MLILSFVAYQLCLLTFAVFLIGCALSDVRSLTIPNRLTAAIALLYPGYLMTSPSPVDWTAAALIAAIVLVVCAGLFAGGFMGGGDAKMMAATALWAGPDLIATFLLFTAMAGGIVSLVILVHARYGWAVGMAPPEDMTQSVPYGVAVAAGGLVVAFTLFLH